MSQPAWPRRSGTACSAGQTTRTCATPTCSRRSPAWATAAASRPWPITCAATEARQRCTQCGLPADRAIAAARREMCLLAPDEQLPVPVRPFSGEMLASYLGRLAAANHLPSPP